MHGLGLICNGFFHVQNLALVHIGCIINADVLSFLEIFPCIQMLARLVAALLELFRKMGLDINVIMLSNVSIKQSSSTSLIIFTVQLAIKRLLLTGLPMGIFSLTLGSGLLYFPSE